jgi:hypothetical protein
MHTDESDFPMPTISEPDPGEISGMIDWINSILTDAGTVLPDEPQRALERASQLIDWGHERIGRLDKALRAFGRAGVAYQFTGGDSPSEIGQGQKRILEHRLQLLAWQCHRIDEAENILRAADRDRLASQPSAGEASPQSGDPTAATGHAIYTAASDRDDIRTLLEELRKAKLYL